MAEPVPCACGGYLLDSHSGVTSVVVMTNDQTGYRHHPAGCEWVEAVFPRGD